MLRNYNANTKFCCDFEDFSRHPQKIIKNNLTAKCASANSSGLSLDTCSALAAHQQKRIS